MSYTSLELVDLPSLKLSHSRCHWIHIESSAWHCHNRSCHASRLVRMKTAENCPLFHFLCFPSWWWHIGPCDNYRMIALLRLTTKIMVIPVRSGLLMPDSKSMQHLVLNSSCTETAWPLKIQHLPSTIHSNVGKTSRAAACDGHITWLRGPRHPSDAPACPGVEVGCCLVYGIPLAWAWKDSVSRYCSVSTHTAICLLKPPSIT